MYNQYYSSADVTLYLSKNDNMILIDKLNGVMLSEELSSMPVYGLGDSYFGFTTRGNYIINGLIDINFIHASYLVNAIKSLNSTPSASKDNAVKQLSDINSVSILSVEELNALKILAKSEKLQFSTQNNSFGQSSVSSDGIAYLKSGFDIIISFNSSTNLRQDSLASEIRIENCRIISSDITTSVNDDSQIVRRYRFIGQKIHEQSI